MSDFRVYFEIGLRHVLDIHGYDHILFLAALTTPYAFKDWKRVLLLVTIFTVGHTTALVLSVYDILNLRAAIVEFLIPCTILVTAIISMSNAGKPPKPSHANISALLTLCFGVIHGLGFSNYFKTILQGTESDKLLPTLEFASGIEVAQVAVVLVMLAFAFAVQRSFRFSRRDTSLVFSAFIAGVALPMVIQNNPWR